MSGVTFAVRLARSMSSVRFVRSAGLVGSALSVLSALSGGAARALAAFCLSALLGAAALAQPASSEQSSWSNLRLPPDPSLSDPLAVRGREVFHARGIACHGEIPERLFGAVFLPAMPGTQALETRYRGEIPAALERRTDLTPALIETVVRKGLNAMPPFRPTEVSNDDLAALVAYLTRRRD